MMTYDEALKVCLEPVRIDNAKYSDVPNFQACRKCKKCLNRKHTDISGRAMAELLTSDHVIALTLTYDNWTGTRAQHLYYRDIQLLLKRLRRDGYKVRFLAAGEYGSKRQRAHWHVCLFFKGKCPDFPPVETEMQHWYYWGDFPAPGKKTNGPVPLGFVYVQKPDFHGLRYVVKYAHKDQVTGKSTRKVQMSLKPPLGAQYWDVLAERDVAADVPFNFSYRLPDCRFGNGNEVEFYATGASAKLKWQAYRKAWGKKHPYKAPPIQEKAQQAWFLNIVPPAIRAYTTNHKERSPLKAGKKTFARVKGFDKFALVKLHSGDLIALRYNGPDRELSLWRVRSLKEAIRLGKGRITEPARKLRFGEVPF